MTSPYRALLAELLLFSEEAGEICMNESLWPKSDPNCTLLDRARALLAQPVAEVPTDEELDAFIYGFFFEDDWYYNTKMERGLARAALARYGGSTSNPTEA
jgi:hypothetical protein